MELPFFTISDLDLEGKTVAMRVDINSPINPDTGQILSLKRIQEHVRSIKRLPQCKLVLLAHQSRPGKKDFTSLREHARELSSILEKRVDFIDDLFGDTALKAVREMKVGDILLLENTRFYSEDVSLKDSSMSVQESTHIVSRLAEIVDIFVNDAFSALHRSQPSLVGFCNLLPSCAGPLMEKEVKALSRVVDDPERPAVVILGGLKVDDSINVAENLLISGSCDTILTTGVVGSMFQWADGYDLGTPNVNFIRQEIPNTDDLLERCRIILKRFPGKVMYPTDMSLNDDGKRRRIKLSELPADATIYDISIDTIVRYSMIIDGARTIIANGPAGVFELKEFREGTVEIFKAINRSKAFSVMGGGETNAVVTQERLRDIDHVSTGGGALINYLSGKEMPVLKALKLSKEKFKDVVEKEPEEEE